MFGLTSIRYRDAPLGLTGSGVAHVSRPKEMPYQPKQFRALLSLLLVFSTGTMPSRAESGHEAWLRYAAVDVVRAGPNPDPLPAALVPLNNSAVGRTAQNELLHGVRGMFGRTLRVETRLPDESAILIGTFSEIKTLAPDFTEPASLHADGFCLKTILAGGHKHLVVSAPNDRGLLYGVFALLRKMALREPLARLDDAENPFANIRMVNQWDNLDGSIERGYAGKSIFWENGHLAKDLTRAGDFARLLASVGLNAACINNVNADARVLTPQYLPELARVAESFGPWGVKLFVAIDFSSPKKTGGLDTFDPLDSRVMAFWKKRADEIYRAIPDFGGFVLKADSEGRLGPSAYGRTHADAANLLARALRPHGGIIFYRGFVYDHHMDWRNLKNDRARAAYDNFHSLDGQFDDNVIVQIKHGPIDFQVREPASPLFGALEKTGEAIELQITQEYLGQQRHLCFLAPMWKQVLDFDLHASGAGTPVKSLVAGHIFKHSIGGFVGVSNVGCDTNWLGNPLALANLYAFGRLAWDPDLSSQRIIDEWTRLTFGHNPRVVKVISRMELNSWRTYENYTGPLGAGTLTDIIGVHFGPGVESSERNGWGQWHRADTNGIGMDRTVATGTGFIGQYRPPVASLYESLKTCPDELLLFFHHVPYLHVLHSGKTVIRHIYDSHYEGAAQAEQLVEQWKSLKGLVDEPRYREVLERLEFQAGHAIVWRDSICQWFLKTSGIPDTGGRAGHFPNRIEAENMKLDGYEIMEVQPWETASAGKAVQCVSSNGGSASFRYLGKSGWFDLAVQYFDQDNGQSRYHIFAADQLLDQWVADNDLPYHAPNGHTSTRRNVRGVALRKGDEIRIEAAPDGGERAAIDYVEISPARR